jgi:hypothetical protein
MSTYTRREAEQVLRAMLGCKPTKEMIDESIDLHLINEHRRANGRPVLSYLSSERIKHHKNLIGLFSPFGEDPWANFKSDRGFAKNVVNDPRISPSLKKFAASYFRNVK